MTEAMVALFGAIFGGAGLKIIEQILSRNKVKLDAASEFRKELREDIQALREELRRVEAELDSWREKYYQLLARFHSERIRSGYPIDELGELPPNRIPGVDSPQET